MQAPWSPFSSASKTVSSWPRSSVCWDRPVLASRFARRVELVNRDQTISFSSARGLGTLFSYVLSPYLFPSLVLSALYSAISNANFWCSLFWMSNGIATIPGWSPYDKLHQQRIEVIDLDYHRVGGCGNGPDAAQLLNEIPPKRCDHCDEWEARLLFFSEWQNRIREKGKIETQVNRSKTVLQPNKFHGTKLKIKKENL